MSPKICCRLTTQKQICNRRNTRAVRDREAAQLFSTALDRPTMSAATDRLLKGVLHEEPLAAVGRSPRFSSNAASVVCYGWNNWPHFLVRRLLYDDSYKPAGLLPEPPARWGMWRVVDSGSLGLGVAFASVRAAAVNGQRQCLAPVPAHRALQMPVG